MKKWFKLYSNRKLFDVDLGNKSALAASNWIFDQPERDLDTPLEDELEMIRAQQAEREREEREREEMLRQ